MKCVYALFALPFLVFDFCKDFKCDPFGILGVFFDTFLDGLQYSVPGPLCPHGFPVFVSFHFSFVHLFRFVPAFVFLTCPFDFLHFASACDALADGQTLYLALTL